MADTEVTVYEATAPFRVKSEWDTYCPDTDAWTGVRSRVLDLCETDSPEEARMYAELEQALFDPDNDAHHYVIDAHNRRVWWPTQGAALPPVEDDVGF